MYLEKNFCFLDINFFFKLNVCSLNKTQKFDFKININEIIYELIYNSITRSSIT